MQNLTPEGLRIVTDVATRHRVSLDAAITLLGALAQGNGRQAQFNHPDLGGLGQWSQGGMIMVGDMFNQGLKYRVDALCNELAGLLRSQPLAEAEAGRFPPQSQSDNRGVSWFVAGAGSAGQWWPAELGSPATTGAQNDSGNPSPKSASHKELDEYRAFPGRVPVRLFGSDVAAPSR